MNTSTLHAYLAEKIGLRDLITKADAEPIVSFLAAYEHGLRALEELGKPVDTSMRRGETAMHVRLNATHGRFNSQGTKAEVRFLEKMDEAGKLIAAGKLAEARKMGEDARAAFDAEQGLIDSTQVAMKEAGWRCAVVICGMIPRINAAVNAYAEVAAKEVASTVTGSLAGAPYAAAAAAGASAVVKGAIIRAGVHAEEGDKSGLPEGFQIQYRDDGMRMLQWVGEWRGHIESAAKAHVELSQDGTRKKISPTQVR